MNRTDAIIDDSYSNEQLASSVDAIFADSSTSTPPLLYSPLESTKIIQSLNLTDTITDDSYSLLHMALQIQISCNQLTEKGTALPALFNVVGH
jgi:hypothetical protein